ncbi:MAG: class I SAM-dependent methyltransferase [Candidatus Omnitrophica bacterium]|nr:class I SAM-dependent methyltransferase [Candidatus Omnitrophota bacterium]
MKTHSFRIKLPPRGHIKAANAADPVDYYYNPLAGWLFRHRINVGLSLLTHPVGAVLEVGMGSGLLVPTLVSACDTYTGIDLFPADNAITREYRVKKTLFLQMDICRTSFPNDFFNTVIAFSVFEHIGNLKDAIQEIARILKPKGKLIAGFPLVGQGMDFCFRLIGFSGTNRSHINPTGKIIDTIAGSLKITRIRTIPACLPFRMALYTCIRAEK